MRLFNLAAAFAPLLIAGACATTSPAVDGVTPAGVDATIEMTAALQFAPSPVTIMAGDTIEFQNVSSFTHTVSTMPNEAAEAADTALPQGASAFDSGPIAGGQTYRQTFAVPGTYRYFCDPHHGAGMKGTIIVQ